MDKVVYKGYVDKLYELTDGTHRLLPSFQKQINKPWIIGYWPDKLLSIVKELTKAPVITIISPDDQIETPITETKQTFFITPSDPEEIIFLKNSAKKLHKEESLLHAQLCKSRSLSVRYDISHKICVNVGPELDRIYKEIKNYNKTGEIPITAKKVDKIQDVKELYNKLNSIKSRLSRLKKLIPEADQPLKEKYQSEEKIKLQLMDEIKSKLGE